MIRRNLILLLRLTGLYRPVRYLYHVHLLKSFVYRDYPIKVEHLSPEGKTIYEALARNEK